MTLIEYISPPTPLCFVLLILPSPCAYPQQGVPLFLPLWWSKNSTTSGQFSRKCFSSPFCRQLEMLRDRLTAEAGGLGRRLFDQSRVSSEISFTGSHFPPFFSVSPCPYSLFPPSLPFLSSPISLTPPPLIFFHPMFLVSYSHFARACWHPRAPEQKVAVLHSWDKWLHWEWHHGRVSAGERGLEDKDSTWTTRLCTDDMGNK